MRKFLTLFLCFSLTTPLLAALPLGSTAPDFTAQSAIAGQQKQFSLAHALKKGPVVLYFYPAAFTPGCTLEANQFAETIPEFRKYGAQVIGMSGDDLETLKKFSTTECRSKFAVAVASPATITAYDVKMGGGNRSTRTSYVVAPDGRIIYALTSPDYRAHVANTLAAVKAWHSGRGKSGPKAQDIPQ